jgi:hypothetical protein
MWHNIGDNDTIFDSLIFSSSPRECWWCSVVLCEFVCTLQHVMYECFFFLYERAVLLLHFLKKLSTKKCK